MKKKKEKYFSRKAFSALIPTPLMAPVQQDAVLGAAFNMCVFVYQGIKGERRLHEAYWGSAAGKTGLTSPEPYGVCLKEVSQK